VDGIERAIRNALAKGDGTDRAFRERVYRSAFAALERTLAGHSEVSDETRQRRRDALKAKVYEIETEYVPAMAPEAPMPPLSRPAHEPPAASRPATPTDSRIEPTLDVGADRRPEPSRPSAAGPGAALPSNATRRGYLRPASVPGPGPSCSWSSSSPW
jgi:hypothetical protein